MLVLTAGLVVGLRKPTARIVPARMAEEEAWSDLAAVMEEAIHGQDDVRTSLARPYVLRLYARRASAVLSRGLLVWRMSAKVTTVAGAVNRAGIAAVVLGGTSILGGNGSIARTLLGVFFLGLVNNAMNILDVPIDMQLIAKGAIIVAALALVARRA
jgi:predicted ABC-type sugar transport system permease subunit